MRDRARLASRALPLLLLAASVAGCGPRSVALYEKVAGSPSYERVTQNLTRTREVHDGLDTRFVFTATWLSEPWVRAFAEEYTGIYYLDSARTERVTGRWRAEAEKYALFFIALWMPDDAANDLEKQGTLWSLRLVRSDEKDFAPVYIRKASMRPEETSRFFPYSGTWFRTYEAAFPKEAESAPAAGTGQPRLKLVLAGTPGRAVLAWE